MMYCGGHGHRLPCPTCAENLEKRKERETMTTNTHTEQSERAELPPLPEPFMSEYNDGMESVPCELFTTDQMHDYARAALLAADKAGGEVVAYMWQHDETGRTGFISADQIERWEEINPRLKIVAPCYTHPQPQADDKAGGEVAAPDLEEIAEQIMRGMRSIGLWDARKSYCVRILRENLYPHPQPQAVPDDEVVKGCSHNIQRHDLEGHHCVKCGAELRQDAAMLKEGK